MSTRKNSSDSTSQNGVSFAAGSSSSANQQKDINLSQTIAPKSAIFQNGAYNGHAVEVWADGAVLDTVTGNFLFPGRDYNVNDLRG